MMNKRFLSLLLALLLLAVTGCGEMVSPFEPEHSDKPSTAPTGDPTASPSTGEDLANDPNAFTVSLRYNGEQYIPRSKDTVIAQWTDGFTFHTAEVSKTDGYARIAGLDGDYQVTLTGVPEGYLYNPNAYVATNNNRQVVIDLYKPVRTTGYGTGPFDCIKIKKTGVYRVELKSASQKVFFQYNPEESGTYSVESWMSTAEGAYNPKVDVYNGSSAFKIFAYTLDNGGVCSGYTQNFRHVVEVADEQIDRGGGGAVFTFAIHVESKNGVYPAYVDFALQLNGSFSFNDNNKTIVIPKEDFKQTPEYEGYTFKWAETDTKGVDGRYVYDGSMFKLWLKEDGGDGYYHLYDVETDTYGAILYAKISSPHRFTELAFTHIEDPGNSSLTVNGTLNHKLFIQGIESLLVDPLENNPQATGGPYFCVHDCPCRKGENSCIGVCGESCTKCTSDCRHLPDEIMAMIDTDPDDDYDPSPEVEKVIISDTHGNKIAIPKCLMGYAAYTNSDGVYAVTEEVRNFLQGFSVSQRYFADGQGWVESNPTVKVDAKEDDQWLFACGYYVKN